MYNKTKNLLKMSEEGYIYCFSNNMLSNIYKVGMTMRSPEIRLKEANKPNTFKLETFKIEFAKKVSEPKKKEKILHKIFDQHSYRFRLNREFFKMPLEEIKSYFDLMDGELWIEQKQDNNEDEENEEEYISDKNEEEYNGDKNNKISNVKCRDATKCFTDGQLIRHIIGIDKIWFGTYNLDKNTITHESEIYSGRSPLNKFAAAHYKSERPDRTPFVNAWNECECYVNEQWISTYDLESK